MSERRFCTVRFNLSKPDHQKAWAYLQNMDRNKFKSYSAVIIAALNEFFDEVDTYSEDRLVERIVQAINNGLGSQTVSITEETAGTEKDIAWDFLGNDIKKG